MVMNGSRFHAQLLGQVLVAKRIVAPFQQQRLGQIENARAGIGRKDSGNILIR